jgi:hypothetical protein
MQAKGGMLCIKWHTPNLTDSEGHMSSEKKTSHKDVKLNQLRVQLAIQTIIVAIPLAILIERILGKVLCIALLAFTVNVTIPVLVKKLFVNPKDE